MQLDPAFPVAWLPFGVGDCDHAHLIRVIEIDHGEGKALKHETAGAVKIAGPALGR